MRLAANSSHRTLTAAAGVGPWLSNVDYCAPVGTLNGLQALIDFRNQLTGHIGSVAFLRRESAQIHHGRARLFWEAEIRGAEPFAAGTDIIVFGTDGRISSVTTFLDRAPEGFDPHAHEQAPVGA